MLLLKKKGLRAERKSGNLYSSSPEVKVDLSKKNFGPSNQQPANSKQQTATSNQQTANSKQQTANSKQQTANSKQQTANSKQGWGSSAKQLSFAKRMSRRRS